MDNMVLDHRYPIYGPFEVVIHNTADDCWLSFHGKIFNVTPLIEKYKGERCVKPLIAFAGKDVSHWFDKKSGEIQHYVHPVTGVEVPYCPHGRIPDVSYQVPTTMWRPLEGPPWWKDSKYQIGVLTKSVRPLRIVNMLTRAEVTMNVCCEDTFEKIREKYSIYNSEADSYVWVHIDRILEMSKTLDENGIPDEREKFAELEIPKSFYRPCIFLYYADDLKHFDDLSDSDGE